MLIFASFYTFLHQNNAGMLSRYAVAYPYILSMGQTCPSLTLGQAQDLAQPYTQTFNNTKT